MSLFSNPNQKRAAAAQDFPLIERIEDGVLVLKGGRGLRSVLMVSSLNFALKSEEEQDALTFAYENFLNTLDFPLQIVISSRFLDITPYIDTLKGREKTELNELLKIQIGEYIEFVKTFVDLSHIVSKSFYISIPFQPSVAEAKGFLPNFSTLVTGTSSAVNTASTEELARYKNQLQQRVEVVSAGLHRLGLRTVPLGTEELVELFYSLHNPENLSRTLPGAKSESSSSS